MGISSINFKEEFFNKNIDQTHIKGKRVAIYIILFYTFFALFGDNTTSFFTNNILAFLGLLPALLFLIFAYTWFNKNKKHILLLFALSYVGLISILSRYLYLVYTNTDIISTAKLEIILIFIIILFTQSVFAYGIRKYLHLIQIIPVIITFILLGVSGNLVLKDWLFIAIIPLIIMFLYITNRIKDRDDFEDFSRTYTIGLNETKLIKEIELRKRAEEELKRHEEKLKQIVEERTNHIKEKSRELEAAKLKAEESDRLKTAFMATMSHELRTPLNAIIGFTELMDNETPRHEFVEFKDIINKSGIRLLATVEDIFQLTYIETKEIELYNEKFNLNGFINSLLGNYEEEKENFHKSYLSLNFKPGLADKDCFISADSKRLKTIFDKLVNNAIKFTKIGAIEIGYKYSTEGKYKENFIFYVKDSGIGISKEFHEVIFDRFRQVEESNTRNYEGSGLGVTIAKELTKLLGGQMWVESELNKGSTFFFSLPLEILGEKIQTKVIPGPKKSIPDFSTKKILIAEDTESNFKLLEQYLKKTKVEIIWAMDGLDAVEFCKMYDNIDLILMDMKMPNMNGYEATMAIKKLGVTCPIIAQTAYALQDDEVKTFTAGCDAYLSKPIKSRELFNCMEKYLKN